MTATADTRPTSREGRALAPGTGDLRPAAATSPMYRTLLRYGVTPFLVGLDAAAFAVSTGIVMRSRAAVAVALVGVVLNAAAGLYRSRLTLSVLDDTVQLVGRAIAAAAVVTTAHVVVSDGATSPRLLAVGALAGVFMLLFRALGYATVRSLRLPLRHGLHARPSARIAELARTFNAHVELRTPEGRTASALSPVAMLALTLGHGAELIVAAGGAQADNAVAAVADLIEKIGEFRSRIRYHRLDAPR